MALVQPRYRVGFGDLDVDVQDIILDYASEKFELSFQNEYEDKEALPGPPLYAGWVVCDVTIKLKRLVTRREVRGNLEFERGNLEFELQRRMRADDRTKYSDAERSRVSRLFEYTHTWKNITRVRFFDNGFDFQCGPGRFELERTPPWFYLALGSDDFTELARELTTSFKMEMTYAAPYVREFEITTPTGGRGFDISYSDRQVTSIYSNGKLVDCDITIQFQHPDKQSRDSTGIEVKFQRKKSNFIGKDGLDLTGQKEQLEMQYVNTWKNVRKIGFYKNSFRECYSMTIFSGGGTPHWVEIPCGLFKTYESGFTDTLGFVKTSDPSNTDKIIFEMPA